MFFWITVVWYGIITNYIKIRYYKLLRIDKKPKLFKF